jgi:hypothetical protein
MRQQPSNGERLLNDLTEIILRFMSLTRQQATVCSLWVVHTHAIAAAMFTPYLNISSALLRCGKTTLLELLSLLAANPWLTGRVTAAVLVRKTDQSHPTLLLDESDAAFHGNSDYSQALRGILNSGYERGGTYSMCVRGGGDWAPKDFSTFGPKAIAGIGKLPDTVEDRSIPMRLKRKLPGEECEKFRKRKVRPEAEALHARAAKWSKRNVAKLAEAEPDMPDELNDRQQDVCEPLIAIADRAGGEWPERARQALVTLLTSDVTREDPQAVRLLADIRSCFEQHDAKRVKSVALVKYLASNEESPWKELSLTQTALARMLKPFEIRPRDLRFDDGIFKGYRRTYFEDAWARYLPPPAPTKKGAITSV